MQRRDKSAGQTATAFTLIEVLVVIAVIAVLVGLLLPALTRAKARANIITCNGHLKNVGLAFRIFSMDNTNRFPWELSSNVGGTREFTSNVSLAWRHFAAISNELATPILVYCPSDRGRQEARNFSQFTNNQYLSYFLGLGAKEENPQSILAGDRNLLLDEKSLEGQLVTLSSNANVAFDQRFHKDAGNVALGDGSVQRVSSARLREATHDAAQVSTNTLVIP